jgi:acyl carrier protein
MEQTIRTFLIARGWLGDDQELLGTDSLVEKGVIDSMAMMELISFIEQAYHIRIQDDEVMPENFDSLASITAYLKRKQGNGR